MSTRFQIPIASRWPPKEGCNKATSYTLVRRRRWVRTRVLIATPLFHLQGNFLAQDPTVPILLESPLPTSPNFIYSSHPDLSHFGKQRSTFESHQTKRRIVPSKSARSTHQHEML